MKYPGDFGKIALTDTTSLAIAFEALELTDYKTAFKKAKSAAEIAQDEEDAARVKEVGGWRRYYVVFLSAVPQQTHCRPVPPRRRRRIRPRPTRC